MNITSINTNQSIYAYPNEKVKAHSLEGVYAPTASEVYSKKTSVGELGNDTAAFYNALDDMAVSSREEIAALKEKFADMYVPAYTARKYYDPSLVGLPNDHVSFEECGSRKAFDLETAACIEANSAGCIIIPLGGGELPQFMDFVLDSLQNGISFKQILQNHFDKQPLFNGEILVGGNHDWFYVNPSNGDVMCALKGGRVQTGSVAIDEVIDREAVYELADDLNTFFRYAAFPQEDDDPEKVKELISYIKNKQAFANFDRFLADGEKGVTDAIMQTLIAAGVLKGDNEEKEEEEEEAVDELMEAIRIHQEELRENKIDMEGSKKAIAEIQEIIKGNKNEFTFLKSSSIA